MYEALHGRIARLAGEGELLRAGLKGVEKECLRADAAGEIAATPHPPALGAALTHPWLTTDYSEALLEFVTAPFRDRAEVVRNLGDAHRFVIRNIGDELLWAGSMPCEIRGDEAIPIARYGTSNSGRLRNLYRVGLGHRYGRMMQVIAGVHFNYSLAPGLWPVLAETGAAHGDRRAWHGTGRALADSHYFGLIRNLFRHGWLLLYLFGASPALSRSFLPAGAPELEAMGEDTWHAPFGTSLRMSDIGYTNRIPGGIGIRYDDPLQLRGEPVPRDHHPASAVGGAGGAARGGVPPAQREPAPDRERVLQLGAPQAADPPRRAADRGAPAAGVRYVELRSIDLDPSSPIGLTEDRLAFLEVFMLFCLLCDSPPLGREERRAIDANQNRVAVRGRDPALTLVREGNEVPMRGLGGGDPRRDRRGGGARPGPERGPRRRSGRGGRGGAAPRSRHRRRPRRPGSSRR